MPTEPLQVPFIKIYQNRTYFLNSTQAHQLLLHLNTTSCHEDTKQFILNSYLIFLPNLFLLVTNCSQRLSLSQKINLLKCSWSPKFFARADIFFIFSILPQQVVNKFFFGMSLLITIYVLGYETKLLSDQVWVNN